MYATILAPDGTVLTMDVTNDWSKSASGSPTNNPVEDGSTIADHYYLEPKSFAMSGMVTFLKAGGSKRNPLTPKEWDVFLESIMESRQPLTVSLDDEFTSPVNNVLITSYSIAKDSTSRDAVAVSLSFQQIIIARRAAETTINVPAQSKATDAGANGDGDLTGSGEDKGKQSTKEPGKTTALGLGSSGKGLVLDVIKELPGLGGS